MRNDYLDYLYHHGIKGQKWGIRRFQNEDGSLTSAGRARYYKDRTKELSREYDQKYGKTSKNNSAKINYIRKKYGEDYEEHQAAFKEQRKKNIKRGTLAAAAALAVIAGASLTAADVIESKKKYERYVNEENNKINKAFLTSEQGFEQDDNDIHIAKGQKVYGNSKNNKISSNEEDTIVARANSEKGSREIKYKTTKEIIAPSKKKEKEMWKQALREMGDNEGADNLTDNQIRILNSTLRKDNIVLTNDNKKLNETFKGIVKSNGYNAVNNLSDNDIRTNNQIYSLDKEAYRRTGSSKISTVTRKTSTKKMTKGY